MFSPGVSFQVCVIGWYYWPDYFAALSHVENVYVIAHRENALQRKFRGCLRENVGLEWGAYNHFLHQFWNRRDPVLFTHDDIRLACPGPVFLEYVECLMAQADEMVGPSYTQFFKMQPHALRRILDDGGFWFDSENRGNVHRNKWKVNRGARAFRRQLRRLAISFSKTNAQGVLEIARRGKLESPVA